MHEKGDGDKSKREMIIQFSHRHDIGENILLVNCTFQIYFFNTSTVIFQNIIVLKSVTMKGKRFVAFYKRSKAMPFSRQQTLLK